MKEKILLVIYQRFAEWTQDRNVACCKGCAACCTQNVTITATEAELIHRYIVEQNKSDWLANILAQKRAAKRPKMTTNDFAKACLDGKDVDPGTADDLTPCLFLENGVCQIYEVRPFTCRAFLSAKTCGPHQPAVITETYAASTTAVSQIVEHLGQKEYWGLLFDVLTSMTDISAYKESANKINEADVLECRMRTLTAKPLVGFLLTEEDWQEAEPLIHSIFSTTIEGKTVEDILNGK